MNLPFQFDGSQTSIVMSESLDGFSVAATRHDALASSSSARVIVAFESDSFASSRHDPLAASRGCIAASAHDVRTATASATRYRRICHSFFILGMIEEQCIEAILERISKISNVVPEFITVRSFCVEILKMFALTLFAQDSDEGVLLT